MRKTDAFDEWQDSDYDIDGSIRSLFTENRWREPSVLIAICANAPMAFTTVNGIKVVPVGCLQD